MRKVEKQALIADMRKHEIIARIQRERDRSGAGGSFRGTVVSGSVTLGSELQLGDRAVGEPRDERAPSAPRSEAVELLKLVYELNERRVSRGQRELGMKKRDKDKNVKIGIDVIDAPSALCSKDERGVEISEVKGVARAKIAPTALCRGAAGVLGQHSRAKRWLRMRLRRSRSRIEVWAYMMKSWFR